MILHTGCAKQPHPVFDEPQYDTAIPAIPRLQWLGDINAIALEWEPNHDPEIAGYYLYRKPKDDEKATFKRVIHIKNRFQSHHIDFNLPTQSKYLYQISAVNHKGFESKPTDPINAVTRPTLQSVTYFTSLDKLPRKAKLIWRPHQNGRVHGYIIERMRPGDKEWTKHATLEHRLFAEYIDDQLDDDQVYMYRLRAKTFDGILSTPSDIVKVITKAVPKSIDKVTVSKELPHSITLSWNPLKQDDIAHYNVYRGSSIDGSYTLIAKVTAPHYEDNLTTYGNIFFYKVSAQDFDGLESEHTQSWLGKNLPIPERVTLRSVDQNQERTTLTWVRGDDRTIKYKIIKREKTGWFKTKTETIVTTAASLETTQEPNVPTSYTIYAIDKYDIQSEPVATSDLVFEKVVQ